MICAVLGQRYLWFFSAPNKTEGRRIANIVLFFESIGASNVIGGFNRETGYWQAKPANFNRDQVMKALKEENPEKIIEIKRRRAPTIDALYLTRLQKERWETK